MSKPEHKWCVQHRGGWCQMWAQSKRGVDQHRTEAFRVPTLCRHYVIMPIGFERRRPTCKECLEAQQ